MVTFSKSQKEILEHYIINSITCHQLSRLMKMLCDEGDNSINMSKDDAEYILNIINNIRDFILELPREEE